MRKQVERVCDIFSPYYFEVETTTDLQKEIDSYAVDKSNIHKVIKESSKQIVDYMVNYDTTDFEGVSLYTVYRAFVMM